MQTHLNQNPQLSKWYHTKPNTLKEYIWWSLNSASIIFFGLELVGTFTEVNLNGTYNPLLWTLTSYTYKDLPFIGQFYPLPQYPFQGNHFFTLLGIGILFFFLLFTLDLDPFWVLVLVFFCITIHEWLWFIGDYIYYYNNHLPFNINWIQGDYKAWFGIFLVVFVFPYKFKVIQKKVLAYVGIMIWIFILWELAGFPVSYDYTGFTNLNNITIHMIEEVIWQFTLFTFAILQPFILHTRKPKEERKLLKWLEKRKSKLQ